MVEYEGIEPNIEPAKKPRLKAVKSAAPVSQDRVRIQLEEADDIPPTGQFVGYNGVGYILRPGVPVEVPLGVKEILDNAVIDVPQIDPDTRQVIGTRPKMRYPYRLVP